MQWLVLHLAHTVGSEIRPLSTSTVSTWPHTTHSNRACLISGMTLLTLMIMPDTVISWSISSGSSSRMWFVFSGKNGRTIRPKRKVATRLYCQIFKLHFLFRCLLNLFRRKIRLNSREEFRQYCLKLRFNRKLYVSTIRNFVSF